jgi:hypothetical protein
VRAVESPARDIKKRVEDTCTPIDDSSMRAATSGAEVPIERCTNLTIREGTPP